MYLDPRNGTQMTAYTEGYNSSIHGIPMTKEYLKNNDNSIIFNFIFMINERYYSFSFMGFSDNDATKIIEYTIQNQPPNPKI